MLTRHVHLYIVTESMWVCYLRGASLASNPLACMRIASLPVPKDTLRERRFWQRMRNAGDRVLRHLGQLYGLRPALAH